MFDIKNQNFNDFSESWKQGIFNHHNTAWLVCHSPTPCPTDSVRTYTQMCTVKYYTFWDRVEGGGAVGSTTKLKKSQKNSWAYLTLTCLNI